VRLLGGPLAAVGQKCDGLGAASGRQRQRCRRADGRVGGLAGDCDIRLEMGKVTMRCDVM
jgi:hypothetical protein